MNFDWAEWGPPLAVIAVGVISAVVSLRGAGQGADEEQYGEQMAAKSRREDLEQARDRAKQQLRDLELRKSAMPDDVYNAERKALLAKGAEAMRALEEGETESETPNSLLEQLRSLRSEAGASDFDAAVAELSGKQPSAMGGEWRGAAYAFGVMLVLAVVYSIAAGDAQDRRPGASMTGNQDLGATEAPPAGQQQPSAAPSPPAWVAEAKAKAEARLAENPNDVDALNELTELAFTVGDLKLAMQHNQKALTLDENNRMGRTYQGVLAHMVGMTDRAVTILTSVLDEDPENGRALTYYGLIALEAGKPAEAAEALEKAMALSGPNPQLQAALQRARQMAGQPQAAPTDAGAAAPLLASGTIQYDGPPPPEGAVLFVFLKPGEGGPPYAAKKLPVGPFPVEFELTKADLIPMVRGRPLPDTLQLSARLDFDGNAMPGSEDEPTATPMGISAGQTGLTLVLQP